MKPQKAPRSRITTGVASFKKLLQKIRKPEVRPFCSSLLVDSIDKFSTGTLTNEYYARKTSLFVGISLLLTG